MARTALIGLLIAAALAGLAPSSAAPIAQAITLTLKDHRFSPSEIRVAAGQRVQILLINQDHATEEFDSHDLKVEVVVTPSGKASFWIGPLQPGAYSFMGEFHPATAQGHVIVSSAVN